MYRVDLVYKPLVRNSRGIRPEEAELKILASVERLIRPVHQIALPVRIFLLQQGHNIGTPPPPGLIHIPRHLDHHDVTELAGLDIFRRLLITRRAATLRADLYDLSGLLHRCQKQTSIL